MTERAAGRVTTRARALSPSLLTALGCGLLVLGLWASPTTSTRAAEEPLPPGATPGGALPRDLRREELPQEEPLGFPIPPVYERPLGTEEGERVFVTEFQITGVSDEPGIDRAEMQALAQERFDEVVRLAEELRREQQQLDSVGPSGFTEAERNRMAEVMEEILQVFDPDEQSRKLQELITELRFERFDREAGLTIGQLQQVADQITRYYRDKGYFLARAIIPAQEVEEGVVEIRVLEGRFGKVITDGNERYSDETLSEPFEELRGELVTEERIVKPLLRVNDMPGLNASGVFQPGDDVGTSDIVLDVQNEQVVNFSGRMDNHLSAFTGDYRFIGELAWNNPIGSGDQLTLTALKSFRPEDSVYGSASYTRPIGDDWSWRLSAARNRFDVGGALQQTGIEIGGLSETGTFGFDKVINRSRFANLYGTVELSAKRAEILEFGEVTREDKLSTLGLQLEWDRILRDDQALESGYVRMDFGLPRLFGAFQNSKVPFIEPPPSREGGSGELGDSSYHKLTFDYQRLKQLSTSAGNQSIFFRIGGQYSDDLLASLEQYSIGGPMNQRGLPVSAFLVDSGITSSFEWTIRAPGFSDEPALNGRNWGQVLSLSVYYDRTIGWLNDPIPGSEQRLHSFGGPGVGLGLDFGDLYFRALAARLTIGEELAEQESTDTQVWFELSYDY